MDKVAAEAGVNKTTLYRRYGDLENLLVEVVRAVTTQAVPTPDTGSLRKDLLTLATAAVTVLDQPTNRTLIAVLVSDGGPSAMREQWWESRTTAVKEIFDRAADRDEILPNLTPEELLERLSGYLHIRTTILRKPPTKRELARLVDELIDARGS